MRRNFLSLVLLLFFVSSTSKVFSQIHTNAAVLQKTAQEQAAREQATFTKLLTLSKERNWPMLKRGRHGQLMRLVGLDYLGLPLYLSTQNNIIAAETIGTNHLWPDGSSGLNLSGSSDYMKGRLAVWDGGGVRTTHVELAGRILQKDRPASIEDHSTHVAGIMISSGVKPEAKGMSFGAQQLIAYDFNSDMSEMASEGSHLFLSNHSYAYNAGWVHNDEDERWEYWGAPKSKEDYKFGYYSTETQTWDDIAYQAPYYLVVKAAGNSRYGNGPAVGETYWRMDNRGDFYNAGKRPDSLSSNDSYDIIPTTGVAKNILTVGAINPIPNGYSKAADAVITDFSSWGPTDDGRIKPDVVADGLNILSCIATSNNAYATFKGTSMAAPGVTGSLLLLDELYATLHSGDSLRSATMKALVIHTADEAGAANGPDYQFGWGVANIKKAADVISSKNTDKLIVEKTLANGKTDTIKVVASGKGKLMATICWTDPKADVDVTNTLNNRTKKLVNDLDLRIKTANTLYTPWVLDVANPSQAATKGDNITDNVERVEVQNAIPGDTALIIISHKKTLRNNSQAYSVIISGAGGNTTCASAALNNGGTRIETVVMNNVNYSNTTSCTNYTNNKTNTTLNIEANQNVSCSIKVGSCDASSATSMVKIFADYNNDGDFDDAGESIAASGTISNGEIYTKIFQTPNNLTIGNTFIMRIVVVETTNINDVKPCGTYAKGETMDFLAKVIPSSSDVGIIQVVNPSAGYCANTAQYITVRIKNFGHTTRGNIPLNITVSDGTNTMAFSETYPDTISSNSTKDYTLQTPFATAKGATYTITAKTTMTGDQNSSNDANTSAITISNPTANPTGRVIICGADNVSLIADSINGAYDVFNWYSSATSTTPLATGSFVRTNVITPDRKYYLAKNDNKLSVGPTDKNTFGVGGYPPEYGQFMGFTAYTPLTIETARLYVGHSGKVTFIVADTSGTDISTGSYYYTPLTSSTIDVYKTQSGNTDNGAIFNVNISIPTGNHVLIVTTSDGATLFRNNGVSGNPYPFTIPNVFSINSNNAGLSNNYQYFYYYLYDMKLRLSNCVSNRIAIDAVSSTVVAPVITLSENRLTSNTSEGKLQWLLNGKPISGANSQTYTARKNGTYQLADTANGGCIMLSNEIYFGNAGSNSADSIFVWPNPNVGTFNISFASELQGNVKVLLYNATGQKVFYNVYNRNTSEYITVNTGIIASGVYVLRVEQGGKIYTKKLVIHN